MALKLRRVRVLVCGRVQGVFFRAATSEQARALGVCGWVRNRSDGQVEIVAEGRASNVEAFLMWCQQGPPRARVDRVEVVDEIPCEEFVGFEVRRDR